MTTVATIKGGAVSSLSTGAALLCQLLACIVDFVNATKDRGERNSAEARRGAC